MILKFWSTTKKQNETFVQMHGSYSKNGVNTIDGLQDNKI